MRPRGDGFQEELVTTAGIDMGEVNTFAPQLAKERVISLADLLLRSPLCRAVAQGSRRLGHGGIEDSYVLLGRSAEVVDLVGRP